MALLKARNAGIAAPALLAVVSACSWTLPPPRGTDAAVDSGTPDSVSVDAGIDVFDATEDTQDVAMDTASTDAPQDAAEDLADAPGCIQLDHQLAEAETVVSPLTPTMNHNLRIVNTSSAGLVGVWRFPVANAMAPVGTTRVRVLLHRAASDPDCGGPCPSGGGDFHLFTLTTPSFDELTATYAERSTGVQWDVSPGGADRGPQVAHTALVDPQQPTLEFTIDVGAFAALGRATVGGKIGFITTASPFPSAEPAAFTAYGNEPALAGTLAEIFYEQCN